MKILTQSILRPGWFSSVVRSRYDLTVMVKGTFRLIPDGIAEIVDEKEQLLFAGDEPYDEDAPTSLRYETDCAPFKIKADLLLTGSCHAPGGEPVQQCAVRFAVGQYQRSLAVFGDRVWKPGILSEASEPIPFTTMPLVYERAFGGPDYEANPVGRGAGREAKLLPNIEDPTDLVQRPGGKHQPAGFGPLHRTWKLRKSKTGTYDQRWLDEKWPGFPDDFDWTYFNCAPPQMQVPGYLRGDEEILLQNLHPEHAVYRCRLPGIRPRCIIRKTEEAGRGLIDLKLRLDTLWVDADKELLVLVWRDFIPVKSPDYEELDVLYLAEERLEDPPAPVAHHFAELEAMLAACSAEEAIPIEIDEGDSGELDPALQAKIDLADERLEKLGQPPKPLLSPEIQAKLDENNKKLMAKAKANLPPDAYTALEEGRWMDFAKAVLAPLGMTLDDAVALVNEKLDKVREGIESHGVDASLIKPFKIDEEKEEPLEPEEPPARARLTRDEVLRRLEAKEGFHEDDLGALDLRELDFSGADLSKAVLDEADLRGCRFLGANLSGARLAWCQLVGADLSGADLTGAVLEAAVIRVATLTDAILGGVNLKRADLTGADLSRASLSGADLSLATLVGARLDEADLTRSKLCGADLRKALMASTLLDGADLTEAVMMGVLAHHASFRGARLVAADLRESWLRECDLSLTVLDKARFDEATLIRTSMMGASGAEVSFEGADLTGLRAVDGCKLPGAKLDWIKAPESMWTGADLQGASIRYSDLPRSSFEGADLRKCDLHAADLRTANLSKAKLAEATVTHADLFQARLERADLTKTDLSWSNCFQVEFLDAIVDQTVLKEANLKGSKLAPLERRR